jgi:hypothetical protein
MMRALLRGGFVWALALAPHALGAGFDGKTALECAPAAVAECDLDAACETVPREEVDLPESLKIDFAAKKIVNQDGSRSSPIRSVDVEDGVLIVQGSQNGRGWSLAIDRASGRMSGTIAETAGAFVVSGACRAP